MADHVVRLVFAKGKEVLLKFHFYGAIFGHGVKVSKGMRN